MSSLPNSAAATPTVPPEFLKTRPTLITAKPDDKVPEVPLTGALMFILFVTLCLLQFHFN